MNPTLARIIQAELKKLEEFSKMEHVLDKDKLEALETLARILQKSKDEEPESTPTNVSAADALALAGSPDEPGQVPPSEYTKPDDVG